MRFIQKDPPRIFHAGKGEHEIKDCGEVYLEPNEQVTFLTPSGTEYDLAKKSWGYYATPSLNGRVKLKGHSAALVRNAKGQDYVMFVERGKEPDFEKYIQDEEERTVLWLDGRDENRIKTFLDTSTALSCVCGSSSMLLVHQYSEPPKAEVKFSFSQSRKYERSLFRCGTCGHFRSIHSMDDAQMYQGDYVDSNYGKTGLKPVYEGIINLPPERSDNKGRTVRVVRFAEKHFVSWLGKETRKPSLIDLGSGLGVFVYEAKKTTGWNCTALDPDPRSCEHARDVVGVPAIEGDVMSVKTDQTFDIVTLNRVVEHVKDPVSLLKQAGLFIKTGGFLYCEVPHATMAIRDPDGPTREEFTIDHPHIFSLPSLAICAERAGLSLVATGTHREPSGKYTLYAFMERP